MSSDSGVSRASILRSLLRLARPRVNRLSGVRSFIAAWDSSSHSRNAWPAKLRSTPFGNINSTGEPGNYTAAALAPAHVDFERSLERGIRELVLTVVRRHGWITYTSCEGHRYPGLHLRPTPRMIGILPRDEAERATILATLAPAVAAVDRRWSNIRLRLTCDALVGDGETFCVVDLVFRRAWGPWSLYFRRVDQVYAALVAQVEARPAASEVRSGDRS